MKGVFVTGTDTGVGKTLASCALMTALARTGRRVAGMKPVAAGAIETPAGLMYEDVAALEAHATVAAPRTLVNPYAFEPPISPHIGARRVGVAIDPALIRQRYGELSALADVTVVEGAGGFCAPLSETLDFADIAAALNLPVLLVVGLRLGCLNHTLLTAAAIQAKGLQLAGWVASQIEPGMPARNDNLALLETRLGRPPLAVWPFDAALTPADAAGYFDAARLEPIFGPEG